MSLQGVKIIDLTRIIAGPFCTQLLADLGADVIKVENPSGDPCAQGERVNDFSWYYAYNRNKMSVALDMRTPEGIEVLKRLLSNADALVENFRPGVLDKMGLCLEVLNDLNPNLVVCSISGFGSDGPYSQRPAFDLIAQALSGFMSVNGEAGGAPLRSGLPISDLVVGLYGALAISSRLVGRDKAAPTGVQTIDVALTDSMISLLSFQAANYLAAGVEPVRSGNDHQLVAPYGVFDTVDGAIALAPSNDGVYRKLLAVLDMEHLLEDERIDTNEKRMQDRALMREILEPVFKAESSGHWIATLNAAGVPAGPSCRYPVFSPTRKCVIAKWSWRLIRGPGYSANAGFPIKFSHDPCHVRHPAPELGEHSADVLQEAGFGAVEISDLVDRGIVKTVRLQS